MHFESAFKTDVGSKRKQNQGSIQPTTRAVVRRIETWNFTGSYDPITHEALCADGTCTTPAANEIGELLAVQMTAANVQPDALFVSKVGTGNVDSSDKLIACGTKCVQPYNAGTLVTLTAKPASGSSAPKVDSGTFSGLSFRGIGPAVVSGRVLDVAVSAVMVALLGFHPALLPALAMKLVPGVDLAPTWTIAAWVAMRGRPVLDAPPPPATPAR